MLEAIEGAAAIHASMDQFERRFSAGGRRIAGLAHGAIWLERLGIWGHFSESARRTPPDKYWNVFGQQPMRLRQNMLVEINPPSRGKNLNRQGVLARDDRGHRWLLHQGRLHPRGMRVTEEKFDAIATARRVKVRYAGGTVAACHPVADLDQPAAQVQHDVAVFIDLCSRVRVHYQLGAAAREMLERIDAAEASSSPERQGAYSLPPSAGEDGRAAARGHLARARQGARCSRCQACQQPVWALRSRPSRAVIRSSASVRDQGRRHGVRHSTRSRTAAALRASRRAALPQDHGTARGTRPAHSESTCRPRYRDAAFHPPRHCGAFRSPSCKEVS